MTELYIDRQPVVLPKDFTLDLIAENPFFTKNGKHTFDLTLSLENPENVKIYRHCNRPNNREEIASNRAALLIADNDVLLNGTEIILEVTDREVKIQLVAGESELNYFVGGDKKLSSLDLGTVKVDDSDYIPVYSSTEDMVYNMYPLVDMFYGVVITGSAAHPLVQPKFLFIITKILTALGYSIQDNALEEVRFLQHLRILNGKKTAHYSRMLPDWTVSEFFTELENLFNIAFIVDDYEKTISIRFKIDYYQNTSKIFIDNVRDEFVETIDRENRLSYHQSNIGYELTDDVYFQYQRLDKAIVDKAEVSTYPSYRDAFLDMINKYNHQSPTYLVPTLRKTIFEDEHSGTQFVLIETPQFERNVRLRKVNIFKDIINNPDNPDLDISLRIIPAPIRVVEIPVYSSDGRNVVIDTMLAPLPVVETTDDAEENFAGIELTIEGDSDTGDSATSDELSLFFYTGQRTVFSKTYWSGKGYLQAQYPIGFVDYVSEDEYRNEDRDIDRGRLTLRLDSKYGLKPLYDSIPIDTVREYTFKFICRKKLDAKAIFVFRNKDFVCKQLKYTVRPEGIDPVVEGVFYPVG
jgi:hypothetical protein